MKKILIIFNILFLILLSSCSEISENRLYIGANELREAAKTFVEENVDSAKAVCYVNDYPENVSRFEETNGEVFSEDYVRKAFELLTDDMYSDLECFECEGTTFPYRFDMIPYGYFAEGDIQIYIPNDPDNTYIESATFHFDSTKKLQIARLCITKNDVSYIFDLLPE